MLREIPLSKIKRIGVIGERPGIWRAGNFPTDGEVLRQGGSDGYRGAHLNKVIKLWCEVFMHAQASMSTGIRLHPARVESVVRLEFAPVWHGCPLKVPTGGLFGEPCLSDSAVFRGVAMAVGSVFVGLLENTKVPKGSRFALCSNRDRHDQERPVPLHDVGCLISDGDLNLYVGWIHRSGGREVKSSVASGPTSASGRGRARYRGPAY